MKKLIPVIFSVAISALCVLTAFNMSLENTTGDGDLTFFVTPAAADADETEINVTSPAEQKTEDTSDFQNTALSTVSPKKISKICST